MTSATFCKTLSPNDVGATGGHQGGILIPKGEKDLLAFLPKLNPKVKNPDAWIECLDEEDNPRRFRYVYYNNKLHDENGTRNEYRITYMTQYFRDLGARAGDAVEISRFSDDAYYRIRVIPQNSSNAANEEDSVVRIKLTAWRRLH